MVQNGFEVHMITTHTSPQKEIRTIDGIRVTYLPIPYDNSYGYWGRIKAYVGFAVKACFESIKLKGVDFCYIMTTPLTTGVIALFNRFFLGRKYFFEVGDLWPLVPIEMGVIKSTLLQRFLYWFEKLCYRKSLGSIGLSPPISDYIQSKSPSTQLATIYNISDCDYFKPQIASADLKKKYGIGYELVITYTGTFGLANDLVRMIHVIKDLQHLPIKFLFIGMGAEKELVQNQAEEYQLQNCRIVDFQSKEGMKEILSISDAMFISFADYPSLFTGSPNKLFDALAAGLLVITNFDGWIKSLIETEDCGFSFIHDSAQDFENKISPFLTNRELLVEYQSNARKLAEERFALQLQTETHQNFLKSLLNS